jgi:hypothetical protein
MYVASVTLSASSAQSWLSRKDAMSIFDGRANCPGRHSDMHERQVIYYIERRRFHRRLSSAGATAMARVRFSGTERERKMDWVLFVVLSTSPPLEKVINVTTVPMATEQLCIAAKSELMKAYQTTHLANPIAVTACLRAR